MLTKCKMKRQCDDVKRAAFTLVELLAAMAFMAIVIPVIMHALAISNRAGQVAQRKAIAARIADRVLSEYVANGQQVRSAQKGVLEEGPYEFQWNISVQNWREDSMRLATAQVTYPVQGQQYSVEMSTLIGLTQ
jgi:type II secretion system protein I